MSLTQENETGPDPLWEPDPVDKIFRDNLIKGWHSACQPVPPESLPYPSPAPAQ